MSPPPLGREPLLWEPVAEELCVLERLIEAPVAGVFEPLPPSVVSSDGATVVRGQIVGSIARSSGRVEIVNPHTGFLVGLLVLPGERVRKGQPLAWVRVAG